MSDINYSKNKSIQEHYLCIFNNELKPIGLVSLQSPVWNSGKILHIVSLVISFSLCSFPGAPIIHMLDFLFSSLLYLFKTFCFNFEKTFSTLFFNTCIIFVSPSCIFFLIFKSHFLFTELYLYSMFHRCNIFSNFSEDINDRILEILFLVSFFKLVSMVYFCLFLPCY